jgi:hypothetical protein
VPFHSDVLRPEDGTPLGSTAVSDDHLLPFVNINCDTVRGLITPLVSGEPEVKRGFLLGRALGRVLAHELYHFLSQAEGHLESGVAKPQFSGADLVNNRFEFNDLALDRLRTSEVISPAELPRLSHSDTALGVTALDDLASGK